MRTITNEQRKWLEKIKNSDKLLEYEQMVIKSIIRYSCYDSDTQRKWLNNDIRKRFI